MKDKIKKILKKNSKNNASHETNTKEETQNRNYYWERRMARDMSKMHDNWYNEGIPALDAVLFTSHYLTNFVFDVIDNPAEANLILSKAISRELLRSKTISEEETQLQ